jgi:hypothetical protein
MFIPCLLNCLWTSLAILDAMSLAPLLILLLILPVDVIELGLADKSNDALDLFGL